MLSDLAIRRIGIGERSAPEVNSGSDNKREAIWPSGVELEGDLAIRRHNNNNNKKDEEHSNQAIRRIAQQTQAIRPSGALV